jgi:hypothetical protein
MPTGGRPTPRPRDGLTIEFRIDSTAPPGDVVGALVALVLGRVRRELAAREQKTPRREDPEEKRKPAL